MIKEGSKKYKERFFRESDHLRGNNSQVAIAISPTIAGKNSFAQFASNEKSVNKIK